jgi:hypothetical protein
MPNWCNNYTTFKGSKENIEALNNAINKAIERETAEKQAQKIHSSELQDCYFFDLYNHDPEPIENGTEMSIGYMTKWCPNLDDLDIICKEFGIDAETWFDEDGCQVHGTAKVYANREYIAEYVEEDFLNMIEWNDEDGMYYYNGNAYESKQDIFEEHYNNLSL